MDLRLTGKRAFISGSTQGIGYAIAKALLGDGAKVVINGRGAAKVNDSVHTLRSEIPGADVMGIPADFSESTDVQRLIETLGPVDILVNNVGHFEVKSFSEITDLDWARYLDVNLMSAVRLSRALLLPMLATGWGRILFISSESGVSVPGDMIHYGVTKAAMLALSNGLSKLTRGTEVTVNTILGGPTYSDGVAATVRQIAAAQGMDAEDLKSGIIGSNNTSLLERFIEPSEIAYLATYVASPLSSATNGAALRADGGVLTSML